MAWLSAGSPPHWLTILTIWMAVNVVLSKLADAFPPTSKVAKALHVWVRINPMDVFGAIKAVGQAVVPPTMGVLLLVACFGVSTSACAAPTGNAAQPTKTATIAVDPQALAAAADKLLWDAWKASATTCLNAATANHDDTIRQRCEPILTGVRNALLTADSAVDVWDAAAQKNFPCLVSSAALGLTQFESLYSMSIPQVVRDGLTLAQSYAGKCAP